jgi:hypothetical protein
MRIILGAALDGYVTPICSMGEQSGTPASAVEVPPAYGDFLEALMTREATDLEGRDE